MFYWKKLKKCLIFCKKSKGSKLKEILTQNTEEFCRQTTLHGMKYVADNELNLCERCFFGISITTVVVFAIYLIARVYDKWISTPVIVGIDPEPTFIANEPFPAITICNLNQALKDVANKFPRNSKEFTMLELLCKRDVKQKDVKSITNWDHVEKFIVNISQPCEDMFIDCRFGGRLIKCIDHFYPLVTDEGYCCTFNILHPKYMYHSHIPLSHHHHSHERDGIQIDWYSEAGYSDDLPPEYEPRKIPGVGMSLGLSVALDVEEDKYYCSSANSVGFKFAVHSPNETPNVRETGFFVEPGKETKLRIKPEKIAADLNLRSIDKRYRHCLFHNEGNLKFFGHYTQRNCEMECVAEMSLKYCGCIGFFMPRIFDNVTVCSISEVPCARAIRLGIYNNSSATCLDDCLPGCFEMNYHVDAFSTRLAEVGLVSSAPRMGNRSRAYMVKNAAIVHMYFKENSFRSFVQAEFFDISDFLSSIGGLMGLFLGFSFLSIAECVYYAIIRPCNSLRKPKQSVDVEKGLLMLPSSLAKSQKSPNILKKRYKKLLLNKKVGNSGLSLFEKRNDVPYSIAYGFDAPMPEGLHYHYCE